MPQDPITARFLELVQKGNALRTLNGDGYASIFLKGAINAHFGVSLEVAEGLAQDVLKGDPASFYSLFGKASIWDSEAAKQPLKLPHYGNQPGMTAESPAPKEGPSLTAGLGEAVHQANQKTPGSPAADIGAGLRHLTGVDKDPRMAAIPFAGEARMAEQLGADVAGRAVEGELGAGTKQVIGQLERGAGKTTGQKVAEGLAGTAVAIKPIVGETGTTPGEIAQHIGQKVSQDQSEKDEMRGAKQEPQLLQGASPVEQSPREHPEQLTEQASIQGTKQKPAQTPTQTPGEGEYGNQEAVTEESLQPKQQKRRQQRQAPQVQQQQSSIDSPGTMVGLRVPRAEGTSSSNDTLTIKSADIEKASFYCREGHEHRSFEAAQECRGHSEIESVKNVAEKIEGKPTVEPINKARGLLLDQLEKELVIWGPASVAIVDREGDLITGPALKKALPQLLLRARLSLSHLDVLPGSILESYEARGRIYKTEVRPLTKEDFVEFSQLTGIAKEGDDALFVVGKIFDDDAQFSWDTTEAILKGELSCYSISGQANIETKKMNCEGYKCKLVTEISDVSLSSVTLCKTPMNSAAHFKVISKSGEEQKGSFVVMAKEWKELLAKDGVNDALVQPEANDVSGTATPGMSPEVTLKSSPNKVIKCPKGCGGSAVERTTGALECSNCGVVGHVKKSCGCGGDCCSDKFWKALDSKVEGLLKEQKLQKWNSTVDRILTLRKSYSLTGKCKKGKTHTLDNGVCKKCGWDADSVKTCEKRGHHLMGSGPSERREEDPDQDYDSCMDCSYWEKNGGEYWV